MDNKIKQQLLGLMEYTDQQANQIINSMKWTSTYCKKEFLGEDNLHFDTVQLSLDSEGDIYFGEFIVDRKSNKYYLRFYNE